MSPKYVVYVDESGNAEGVAPGHEFPVFLLALCIFEVSEYVNFVVPSFQRMKFEFFGHDLVVLHEREIRRKIGAFKFLNRQSVSDGFQAALTEVMASADFQIISEAVTVEGAQPSDLYTQVLGKAISRVDALVNADYVVILESRGKSQDRQVSDYLKSIDGPRGIKFATKKAMATGLQIADLVARPIVMNILKPEQPNRAFEAIRAKIQIKKTMAPLSRSHCRRTDLRQKLGALGLTPTGHAGPFIQILFVGADRGQVISVLC